MNKSRKKWPRVFVLIIGLSILTWAVLPFFRKKEVSETITAVMRETGQTSTETVRQGAFEGRALHKAQGTVKLVKSGNVWYVRFEEDFKMTNGPDLFVYLGKNDKYDSTARLGPLKGNIGSQNYRLPDTVDPQNYTEVWVWCRAFSVPFAKAVIK